MQSYKGSCHCQKVQYEVTLENLSEVMSCNCSMCSRRGWLLAFAPLSAFKLITGEDEQTDYQFNKHLLHHLFCATCGVASYAIGKDDKGNESVAINVRCLADVDVSTLKINSFDGKSL